MRRLDPARSNRIACDPCEGAWFFADACPRFRTGQRRSTRASTRRGLRLGLLWPRQGRVHFGCLRLAPDELLLLLRAVVAAGRAVLVGAARRRRLTEVAGACAVPAFPCVAEGARTEGAAHAGIERAVEALRRG